MSEEFGRPLYLRIADDLRQKIVGGELADGARIDSESRLVTQWSTTRSTVRQALEVVRSEGLIEKQMGRGAFVRRRPTADSRRILRNRGVHRDERGYYFDPAAADWVALAPPVLSRGTAPRDIADMLGVPADTQVVIRDRRMGPAGGQILHISTSYLPADLAAGTPLEAINTGPGGIYDRMEQDMGLRLSWVDYYAARMPTADEASILGVPISVPLLRIIRVTDDESGRVVEVNDTRMSSEKFMVARPLVRAAEA